MKGQRHNKETNTTLSCAPLLGCFITTVSQFLLLYTCSLYVMSGRGIHKDLGGGVSFTVMGRRLASQVNQRIEKTKNKEQTQSRAHTHSYAHI